MLNVISWLLERDSFRCFTRVGIEGLQLRGYGKLISTHPGKLGAAIHKPQYTRNFLSLVYCGCVLRQPFILPYMVNFINRRSPQYTRRRSAQGINSILRTAVLCVLRRGYHLLYSCHSTWGAVVHEEEKSILCAAALQFQSFYTAPFYPIPKECIGVPENGVKMHLRYATVHIHCLMFLIVLSICRDMWLFIIF